MTLNLLVSSNPFSQIYQTDLPEMADQRTSCSGAWANPLCSNSESQQSFFSIVKAISQGFCKIVYDDLPETKEIA
jgi:hypothetical protein